MTTLSMTTARSAAYGYRVSLPVRPARNVGRTIAVARDSNPIPSVHLALAADMTMRMGLALVPFSALAWMFLAR